MSDTTSATLSPRSTATIEEEQITRNMTELQNIQGAYKLNGKNYLKWSQLVRTYLKGKGKLGHLVKEAPASGSAGFEAWEEEDSMIMSWLWNSMTPEISDMCMFPSTAKGIWDTLYQTYSKVNDAALIYDIKTKTNGAKQGTKTVTEYANFLQNQWQELDYYRTLDLNCSRCAVSIKKFIERDRVYDFLSGLNTEFDLVRIQIFGRPEFPSLAEAISLVRAEESRMSVMLEPSSNENSALLSTKNQGLGLDVPSYLEYVHNHEERLKKEQEEKVHKKKEKAEAHLYTIIKVARDEDLAEQIGKDIYFDLVDHDKVRSFRVQKEMFFNVFREEVAKEFGIPVQFQRFWLWSKLQNHTYRPHRPLSHHLLCRVGQLGEVSNKVHNAELKLFLEVELGLDLRPIAPPEKTKDNILLFFKLYDPKKQELRYVGRLFVKSTGMPLKILTRLNEMAGYDPGEMIALYEEIKFERNVMCVPIDKKLTFRASELEDGDIVCFQKAPSMDIDEHVRYPDVPSYLEYVHNRQVVRFRSLDKRKEDDFSLEM